MSVLQVLVTFDHSALTFVLKLKRLWGVLRVTARKILQEDVPAAFEANNGFKASAFREMGSIRDIVYRIARG